MYRQKSLALASVLAVGSSILLWPAVLNGYPLVYWDTGAYIWSSLDWQVPLDRPIGYSLIVGFSRIVHSLWLAIGFQALVTSYLLVRTIMHLLPTTFGRRLGLSLLVLVMTAATTGVARYVSYVMPDILAAWIVLGGLLLIFARRRLERAIAGLTIVLSVVVHNSNLPLGIAFGAVLLGTTACLRPSIDIRRLRDLLAVLVLGAATAAVMNWALGAGFTLSRGAPTFMVNRLAASGVLSQTLATYCPQVGWRLCTSQEVIRQPHADAGWWFLWGDDSPLRTLGWEQGGGEQSDVVRHALRCCLGSILHASAESSWQQLQQFNPSQDLPRLETDASAYNAIRLIYPNEFLAFLTGRQQSGQVIQVRLLPGDDAPVFALFAACAALVAAGCWRRGLARPLLFVVVVLACTLLNAVIVGSLNGADDRQQARVAWLVPASLWAGLLALAQRGASSTRGEVRGRQVWSMRLTLVSGWLAPLAVALGVTVWSWFSAPRPLDPDAQQYVELANLGAVFGTYREPVWIVLLMAAEAVLGPTREAARAVGLAGFLLLVVAFELMSRRLLGRLFGSLLALTFAAVPWLAFQATRGLREETAAGGLLLVALGASDAAWLRRRGPLLAIGAGLLALLRWDTLPLTLALLAVAWWRAKVHPRSWIPSVVILACMFSALPVINSVLLGDPFAHTNEHATYFAYTEFGWTRTDTSPVLSWGAYIFGLHSPLEIVARVAAGSVVGPTRVLAAALRQPAGACATLLVLAWGGALLLRRTTPGWTVTLLLALTSLEFSFIGGLMDERLELAIFPLVVLCVTAGAGQVIAWARRPTALQAAGRTFGAGVLIEQYYPHVAGAERQVESRIPALAERGIHSLVVTRLAPGLSRRAIHVGAVVYRVPSTGGRVLASVRYTLGALWVLRRQRHELQVVHAYDLFSPTTIGMLAKLLFGLPLVAELLGGGLTGDLAVLRRVRSGRLRLWLMRRLVDRFIALSAEVECGLRGAGVAAERIVRIANGVDIEKFRPAATDQRIQLRADLQLHERVVLYVGRLHPEKGVDILLDAWPAILCAVPDATLILVGTGPLFDELQRRGTSRTRFVGLSDPLPYLQSADCFVLPSRSEGLPVALLEAMAAELACVATAIGGTVDVITDGLDGWLVPPADVAALAAGVVRALTAPERIQVSLAARARVVRDFSLHSTAAKLARLYRDLASAV